MRIRHPAQVSYRRRRKKIVPQNHYVAASMAAHNSAVVVVEEEEYEYDATAPSSATHSDALAAMKDYRPISPSPPTWRPARLLALL